MRKNASTPPNNGRLQQIRTSPRQPSLLALCIALAFSAGAPLAHAAQAEAPAMPNQRAAAHWQDLVLPAEAASAATAKSGASASTARIAGGNSAKTPALRLKRLRGAMLDLGAMRAHASGAPAERSSRALASPLTVSLPHPDGGYQRFTLIESSIMEPELAAKHPDIKTYKGQGIDDPNATLRMDVTPLGLHASVRSPRGGYYVDPYYKGDDSVYASYSRSDLVNEHGPLVEGDTGEAQLILSRSFYKEGDTVEVRGSGFAPGASVDLTLRGEGEGDGAVLQTVRATADKDGAITVALQPGPSGSFEVGASDGATSSAAAFQVIDAAASTDAIAGGQLRTYRLALVTDPSYATYFGGPANVTAAKVTLINRVTQVYEDETSIRLVLINATDKLNLNTAAEMTGANGPCGGSACYTTAQAASCSSGLLTRNRTVAGLLAGAGNYDVGHIALGLNGGGIASLGVVGLAAKAQGCTGIPTPVGDFFAVDYVAHELGHQFAGNHTFNGVISNCSGGNRSAANSVEVGSGSSIMAYAGICGTDNLQSHSDPYWSQRSFDEIVAHTSAAESTLSEVQVGVLTNYAANGQQFQVSYAGNLSAPIIRGTNYTTAGVKAAIEGIAGWPAGGTATVSALSDTTFTVTFGGTLAGLDVAPLSLVGCTAGCTGYINDVTAGGPSTRRGAVSANANVAPSVTTQPLYTIPVRTPFALTGSATDANDDPITYMWEQNDRGAATGTGLISNTKLNGPLFRQFGTRAIVTSAATLEYGSAGENHTTGDPTRVFPDMAQILSNNTNAATGACPTAQTTPTAADIECFSEYLPTAAYVGFAGVNAAPASLNFKLTARDGRGGLNNATTRLVLAPAAGPFLVTSPNTAVTLAAGTAQTVTWSVANTNVAPVNTANVKITLSVDGGTTWPYVLAASVPNSGSASVTLPALATTAARIKIEAIDNVFFDVSNADFTIKLTGDANGDNTVDCADLAIVKASLGKRTGQAGFDARADLTGDGLVDARDLAYVSQRLPKGTVCN
jgi:hypothetical protein